MEYKYKAYLPTYFYTIDVWAIDENNARKILRETFGYNRLPNGTIITKTGV